jgi:hypothetical protein
VPVNEEHARGIAAMLAQFDLKRIEPGEIGELIKQADWLIHQIGTVSSTPVPSMLGGDTQSGEALKQRSVNLVGKAQRAQVQFGNSWEDVFSLGWRQENLFGQDKPPAIGLLSARWKSAEIRNDADLREGAKLMHEMGFTREALRILSQTSVVQYSEADIDALMEERTGDEAGALAGLQLPGFDGFEI